ncbi:hypothetical protein TSUD_72680 [Trifolium subterraneum]|uniref:Reverse transcriptase zinc-binding domain-containing protein n=1 Tax=Trifolium subterraneum TaxID=3900 RepID=A0A2Z6LV47_TRISU|nr:hypothetical protein TSUD_72680 [Trifolium subterraneum]
MSLERLELQNWQITCVLEVVLPCIPRVHDNEAYAGGRNESGLGILLRLEDTVEPSSRGEDRAGPDRRVAEAEKLMAIEEESQKRVESGDTTLFWTAVWIGDQPLRHKFPRLFGISSQQNEVIRNLGCVVNGQWSWALQWRRNFFVWEEEQYREFMEIIVSFVPSVHQDRWLWLGNCPHGFTANSAYLMLAGVYMTQRQDDPLAEYVFNNLWKCGAPSKACALGWQLLLDRIPTKNNLLKRRMIQEQQAICVLCNLTMETAPHLFLHCDCVAMAWYDITRWLGFVIVLPHNLLSSFAVLLSCAKNKKEKALDHSETCGSCTSRRGDVRWITGCSSLTKDGFVDSMTERKISGTRILRHQLALL